MGTRKREGTWNDIIPAICFYKLVKYLIFSIRPALLNNISMTVLLIVYVQMTEYCLLVLFVCNKQVISYWHVTGMWCDQVGRKKRRVYTIEMDLNNFKQIGDRMYQFVGKFKPHGIILGVFIDSQTVAIGLSKGRVLDRTYVGVFCGIFRYEKSYNSEC